MLEFPAGCGLPQAHPGTPHLLGCPVSSHLLVSPRLATGEFIPALGVVFFGTFWSLKTRILFFTITYRIGYSCPTMRSHGTEASSLSARLITALLMTVSVVAGYDLDLSSIGDFPLSTPSTLLLLTFLVQDSLKHAASFMAQDMMSFYSGDQPGGIPGLLPQPYYCQ